MTDFEHEFYQLLSGVMDLIGRTEEEALEAGAFDNLSRSEMHTLTTIGPYEEKSMGESASQIGVTTGTLTVQIERLVKKGYVIRQRKASDRRVVLLRLSKRGKIACRMRNKFNRLLLEHILEPLNHEEQKILFHSVKRVDEYLQEQRKKYAARKEARNRKATE